ncbi:MAG: flagellar motor switch protein FliN [bacterium]
MTDNYSDDNMNNASGVDGEHDISFLNEIEVTVTVELGRTVMSVKDILKLHRGSVVELEKLVGQPVDLLINGTPMAKGEVIVINERFGFRITKFLTQNESV